MSPADSAVVLSSVAAIITLLFIVLFREKQMSVTLQDLDAAIAQQGADEKAAFTSLASGVQLIIDDCNELLAKNPDFASEVAAIQANAQTMKDAISAATTAITAEDQKVNPPGPSDFTPPAK